MLVSIRCDKTKLRETPKAIKLVLTHKDNLALYINGNKKMLNL